MTQSIQSRYFGEKKLDLHYNSLVADDVAISVDGKRVAIDLWFEENDHITMEQIAAVDQFLDNVASHMESIVSAIHQDVTQSENGGEVKEYLEWHLDELDSEALNILGIDTNWDKATQFKHLLSTLHLVRVGIYPTEGISESYAVFDFTISREVTDYLIVVNTDKNGKIIEITTES